MTDRQVWKFGLSLGMSAIPMPEGAEILTVQMQHGSPVLWALVNPNKPTEHRHILLTGTGHPITHDGPLAFIGTIQQANGALIWHAFEVLP